MVIHCPGKSDPGRRGGIWCLLFDNTRNGYCDLFATRLLLPRQICPVARRTPSAHSAQPSLRYTSTLAPTGPRQTVVTARTSRTIPSTRRCRTS